MHAHSEGQQSSVMDTRHPHSAQSAIDAQHAAAVQEDADMAMAMQLQVRAYVHQKKSCKPRGTYHSLHLMSWANSVLKADCISSNSNASIKNLSRPAQPWELPSRCACMVVVPDTHAFLSARAYVNVVNGRVWCDSKSIVCNRSKTWSCKRVFSRVACKGLILRLAFAIAVESVCLNLVTTNVVMV